MSGTESELLRTVFSIASPLALLTAVLYYFGWVRTRVQAAALGFDSGVLNLSTTDYLLKSVNVLFPFIVVVLLVAIGAQALYRSRVERAVRTRLGRRRLLTLGRALRYLVLGCAVGGVALLFVPGVPDVALPVGLTAAVLLAMASQDLTHRATDSHRLSATGRALALALLSLLIFWDTERFARYMGEQFAADYRDRPEQFAATTVYSRDDLRLDAAGIEANKLGGSNDDYRFRYRGLRLMERAADRYVLINEDWRDGHGRVVVLIESDRIRVEFGAAS